MITWLADALRKEKGLKVVETRGWKTRGRPGAFDGTEGVVFHHTASPLTMTTETTLRIVTDGRIDLPGPLCHVMVGRNGVAYVVAAGYAAHAGDGGPFRTVPLNSGNRYMVGVEVENDGKHEPFGDVVLGACDRVFAAVLKHQGKDSTWCIGHKEWTTRKPDPHTDMAKYRTRLARYLRGDDMTDKEKAQLAEALRKAREAELRLAGAADRLRGDPQPRGPEARRWGWTFADMALTQPSTTPPRTSPGRTARGEGNSTRTARGPRTTGTRTSAARGRGRRTAPTG
jgi:hypothetical protein